MRDSIKGLHSGNRRHYAIGEGCCLQKVGAFGPKKRRSYSLQDDLEDYNGRDNGKNHQSQGPRLEKPKSQAGDASGNMLNEETARER